MRIFRRQLIAKSLGASGINTPVSAFLGRWFYVPDSFLRIANVHVVYNSPAKFAPTILSHVPFALFQISLFGYYVINPTLPAELYALYGITNILLQILIGLVQHVKTRMYKVTSKVYALEMP